MKYDSIKYIKITALAAAVLFGTACGQRIEYVNPDEVEYEAEAVIETESETETETQTEAEKEFDYTIAFTGDITLDDGGYTTTHWLDSGKDINACFDETILGELKGADICFVNNEFPYSTRGSATVGKDYTYRSDPSNVSFMKDIGADIVSLANNHAYDYGEDALLDTLDTLDKAGIDHVGAGRDLEEASETKYIELDGLKVAFISGTRVEWVELTKGATETEAGVFRTVEPELLYQRVDEAKKEADLVVVYIHWGIEGVTYLEDYQMEVGKGLVDHGADAVIGDHTHCLQGIEFYKDKPIIYSLGNFFFNARTMDTAVAELHVRGTRSDHEVSLQYIPAVQSECKVSYISDEAGQETYYSFLESISENISFDKEGYCREAG